MSDLNTSNNTSKDLLTYLSPSTIILDLQFIRTTGKKLVINYPYLYVEGKKSQPIRLLDVSDYDGEVHMKLQNLDTDNAFSIGWNMEYTGDYVMWYIYDLQYYREFVKTDVANFIRNRTNSPRPKNN